VRVLFTYAGGSGHVDPLVSVADAVRASGHATAFFGRRSAAVVLEANGFRLFADTDDPALTTGDDAPITPLLELDMEREYRDLVGFADRICPRCSVRASERRACA
jgi:UDP:flavonoid glycosyltransferase YjiC (YdhE family)